VDENGKKIDDRFEHRRSMDVCRELEQKYGLIPADQKKRQEGLPLKPVRYEDGDVKHQIANVIRPIAQSWHFQRLKEYNALLSLYNISMEEVRGEAKGKPYSGIVYSALDSKGEKAGHPFKSSLFGKSVGYDALQKHIEKSAETIKNKGLKERSKKVIAAAMHTCKTRPDFEKALAKQGISALVRTNEEGRIYGATLIDPEQNCVFNGSRLGKEFSANVFNDLFTGKDITHDLQDDRINPNTELGSGKSFNRESQDLGVGGLFDILSPETQGENPEEEAFIRKMKRKKRKQKRRM
jgi:hypothetical protein